MGALIANAKASKTTKSLLFKHYTYYFFFKFIICITIYINLVQVRRVLNYVHFQKSEDFMHIAAHIVKAHEKHYSIHEVTIMRAGGSL